VFCRFSLISAASSESSVCCTKVKCVSMSMSMSNLLSLSKVARVTNVNSRQGPHHLLLSVARESNSNRTNPCAAVSLQTRAWSLARGSHLLFPSSSRAAILKRMLLLSSARCESNAFDCADVSSFRLCRIDPIYSLRGAESTTLGSEPFQCSLLSPQKPHCDSAVVRRRVGAVKSLSFVSDRARARGYLHSALYEARGSCVFCMSSPEHLIFIVRLWPVIRIFRTVIQIETNLAIGTV